MDYTILQAPADSESVVDALGTLAPGWSDRDGVEHAQGWTSVRLDRSAADRFAPLLAKLLRRGVLVWDVSPEHSQVSWHQEGGEVLSAGDRQGEVDAFVKAFKSSHVLMSSEDSQAALPDASGSPVERHRALAEHLGVPYVVPEASPRPLAVTPAVSEASLAHGEERFRQQQRVRGARSWLHLASGLGVVAAVAMVIRGPLIGVGIACVVSGALQVVRFLLGRSLPRSR